MLLMLLVLLHTGCSGAGARKLGGWSGANHAHRLSSGPVADAQRRHVS